MLLPVSVADRQAAEVAFLLHHGADGPLQSGIRLGWCHWMKSSQAKRSGTWKLRAPVCCQACNSSPRRL